MSRLAKLVPRSLQPRLEQLRRDVRTVVADLRGERAPTWLPRSGARYPTSPIATRETEPVEVVRSDARVQVRDAHPLIVAIGTREVELIVQPGQTLLEAGLAAGLAMPHSCTVGGCATCKVRLEHGEVVMQEPNCLGPDERVDGFVLACIASPTRPSRIRVS